MSAWGDRPRWVDGLRALAGALVLLWAVSAQANLPLGACCLENLACQDLMSTQCEGASGDFLGEGTTCATTRCGATSAPLAGIFGLVALGGALAAFGVRRLMRTGVRGRAPGAGLS